MSLFKDRNRQQLRDAGWRSRGYLPHFDGRPVTQFISLHLADSIPRAVLEQWRRELKNKNSKKQKLILQRRIARYADYGHGEAFFRFPHIAKVVQDALLEFDASATVYSPGL